MSLIMDALEKVQRETKPPTAVAELTVLDRAAPTVTAIPREEFTGIRVEENLPTRRGRGFFVLLFAILSLAAALMIFKKIPAGAGSLPPMRGSTGAVPAMPSLAGPGLLRGILQDPAGSFCILGDQILKTGDAWRGYTVLSIEAREVVVQDAQRNLLTLHLQES